MPAFSFTPFPYLTTERLLLRQLTAQDAAQIFLLRTDEVVNRYIERPKAKSLDDSSEFIKAINFGIDANEWIFWGIELKGKPELAGTICLWNFSETENKAEIGYELLPEFHGLGIMQEALLKVIEFGFNVLYLEKIEAWTTAPNKGSTKMLERNSFKRDGDAESRINREVEGPDRVIYRLLKTDYLKIRHS